jgi:hypothetical protein
MPLLAQVAIPSQTPAPDPVVVIPDAPLPDWFPQFVIAAIGLVVGGIILYPLAKAWARRIAGGTLSDSRVELDDLHARVAQIERLEARVAELEDRADFSERLLTQAREGTVQSGREQP